MKKKVMFLIFLVVLITAFLTFILLTLFLYPPIQEIKDKYYLGAHRGNSVEYIENTLPAFESALKNSQYHFIEFDVQYTKDKALVVHHDKTLLRLQKKLDWIQDLTYEELQNTSEYYIPTYKEVMDLLAGKKPLDIEIKSNGNLTEDLEIADYIIEDLEEREIRNTTLVSSISLELVQAINNKYNNLSNYSDNYSQFWAQKRYINTGLIFYIDESTFTTRIPIVNYLTELLRDKGIFDSMISSWWLSGANHLMVHGTNIRQYYNLRSEIPFNSKFILWTFDDKIYLILPDEKIWSWQKEINGLELPKVLPWWQDV